MALSRSKIVVGALALAAAVGMSADRIVAAGANGERTISFYHIHTKERLTVTYKRNGRYIPEAMKKIDWIMRDWRKNTAIVISPETIDLAWEMHEELGSREPIHIICGYRSAATNSMLRKTRGGQAKKSQHMTGRAIDITFPDVPLKRMRYAALVRERGGVGYYPTSGIPFVHIDTARVRAWPRLPRYELALLFPSGKTKHRPAAGGPITPVDVRVARTNYKELSVQIAHFQKTRIGLAAPVLIASASKPKAPEPQPAKKAAPRFAVASLSPETAKQPVRRQIDLKSEPIAKPIGLAPAYAPASRPLKQLASLTPAQAPRASVAKPAAERKQVDRSSRFTPSNSDRSMLNALVKQAADMPPPRLVAGPAPAVRPQKQLAAVAAATSDMATRPLAAATGPKVASLGPAAAIDAVTDMDPDGLGNGWVPAPAYDDDHPEELAYRPFPLAPLLTETASANDPSLVLDLEHPDVAATLDALDDAGAIAPMRFRPGRQLAQLMWAQQFQGQAVHLAALKEIEQNRLPPAIASRQVKTSAR